MGEAGNTMAEVSAALATAMGTVATNALDAVADIVPIAAPVLGAILIIGIGIRTFKKLVKG